MFQSGKPKYLIVVPSSCQMYSGTGTAIFDWVRFAKNDFDFSILIDNDVPENARIVAEFCASELVNLLSGTHHFLPGCVDVVIREIPIVVMSHPFSVVECVSWANSGNNMSVLAAISDETCLVYTPHTQPLWTVPAGSQLACVVPVFREMASRADAIFLDSETERQSPLFDGLDSGNCHVVPLGVDTDRFRARVRRKPFQVLSVCDFHEIRKRVDLLISTFIALNEVQPDIEFVLAGKGSELVDLPPRLASATRRLGYVSSDDLVKLYNQSSVFVLLSDFEAFGLPIAEALCCGCQVLLNRQDVMVDLFGSMPGVQFTRNTDVDASAAALGKMLLSPLPPNHIAQDARERFSLENTYGRKLKILNDVMAEKGLCVW